MNWLRHVVLWLLVVGVLGETGCARVSGLRRKIFHREATVPAAELGRLPLGPSTERGLGPQQPRRAGGRSGLLTPLRQHSTWQSFGQSVEGRPIEAMLVGSGPVRILLIGGIHGDEPEGLPLVERLAEELVSGRSLSPGTTVLLIRNLNPDGTVARTRTNRNGVDLNRNFPASNWDSTAQQPRFNPGSRPASEPETQLLVQVIRQFRPDRILVLHATRGKPMVNYDGPARKLAEAMSQLNGYVASDTIGYPTPGSLGSYAGLDMQVPIITLELPRGLDAEAAWDSNAQALLRFLQ